MEDRAAALQTDKLEDADAELDYEIESFDNDNSLTRLLEGQNYNLDPVSESIIQQI